MIHVLQANEFEGFLKINLLLRTDFFLIQKNLLVYIKNVFNILMKFIQQEISIQISIKNHLTPIIRSSNNKIIKYKITNKILRQDHPHNMFNGWQVIVYFVKGFLDKERHNRLESISYFVFKYNNELLE